MRAPKDYAGLLYSVMMSLLVSSTISFVLSVLEVGLGSGFWRSGSRGSGWGR